MTRRPTFARSLHRAAGMARNALGGALFAGGFLALCWAAGLASVP